MHQTILQIAVLSSAILGVTGLTRDEALSAAQRVVADGGVKLDDFEVTKTHKEPNGQWSFLYECKLRKPDCGFLVLVNSSTGRVTITSEMNRPLPEGIPESIQEAAFASEISQRKGFVACLEVQGTSPSQELMAKLAQGGATVVDASECEANMDVEKGSSHKPTGKSAIFYGLSGLHKTDASHATIEFKSYHHGLDAEGVTLFLELKAGKWVVAKRQSNWIS
jgi:hypothetical protein